MPERHICIGLLRAQTWIGLRNLIQHEAVELFGAVGNGGVGELAPK